MKAFAIATGAVLLAGCSGPSPQVRQESEKFAMIAAAQDIVRSRLKDPDSAQFRNDHIATFAGKSVACGEVNASNSFGGKTGFKRYIAQSESVVVTEDDMTAAEFSDAWAKIC